MLRLVRPRNRGLFTRHFSVEDNLERRILEMRSSRRRERENTERNVGKPQQHQQHGFVEDTLEGVVRFKGDLPIRSNSFVRFENGSRGFVVRVDERSHALLLDNKIPEMGDRVRTMRDPYIPSSTHFRGRIVDALGEPLDGMGAIVAKDGGNASDDPRRIPLFGSKSTKAGWLLDTSPIVEPLRTGTKVIDGLYPIGRGHRVSISGSKSTGKTSLALNILTHQARACAQRSESERARQPHHYIYLSYGQSRTSVAKLVSSLRSDKRVQDRTTLVAVTPEDSPGKQILGLQTALTLASDARDSGATAILICDELSAYSALHEKMQRRVPVLTVPAVRAAQLLEPASQLSAAAGSGSLTIFLLVDADERDGTLERARTLSASETLSAAILQSLTEGARSTSDVWLQTETKLVNRGIFPPIGLKSSPQGAPLPQYQSLAMAHLGMALRRMVADRSQGAASAFFAANFGISSEEEGFVEDYESMQFLDALHVLLEQSPDEDEKGESTRTLVDMCIATGGSLEDIILSCARNGLKDAETAEIVRNLESVVWSTIVSDAGLLRYATQLAEASAARPTTKTLNRSPSVLLEPLQNAVTVAGDAFRRTLDDTDGPNRRREEVFIRTEPAPRRRSTKPQSFDPFKLW
eukprot:g850.t1